MKEHDPRLAVGKFWFCAALSEARSVKHDSPVFSARCKRADRFKDLVMFVGNCGFKFLKPQHTTHTTVRSFESSNSAGDLLVSPSTLELHIFIQAVWSLEGSSKLGVLGGGVGMGSRALVGLRIIPARLHDMVLCAQDTTPLEEENLASVLRPGPHDTAHRGIDIDGIVVLNGMMS